MLDLTSVGELVSEHRVPVIALATITSIVLINRLFFSGPSADEIAKKGAPPSRVFQ